MLKDCLKENNFNKLSIAIPTFNEEKNIGPMIEECIDFFGDNADILELLIVNDKSTDDSLKISNSLAEKYSSVRVIDNNENIGCHPSQLVGWNNSEADVLYMLPSDRQIPPNSIPELILNLKNNDIVWTNRVPRNDPSFRKIVSFFYNLISKKLFNLVPNDVDSAVMIRNESYKKLNKYLDSKSAFIQVQIGFIATNLNFNQIQVNISHRPRLAGAAKGINLHDVTWVPKELVSLFQQRNKFKNLKIEG
jgi:glycosyltransferase involved in cell wall biosynthesis|tara:strand:- start:809 stop:1555 length:747 start_codon:yes stop_codon:yes gene_type:complete